MQQKVKNEVGESVFEERTITLQSMEGEIPEDVLANLKKRNHISSDAKSHKLVQNPHIRMPDIEALNVKLLNAIHIHEQCIHKYEFNIVNCKYFENIVESVKNHDSLQPNKFTQLADRHIIFRVFEGFEFFWYKYLHFPLSMLKLLFFTIMSVFVFFGQFQMFFKDESFIVTMLSSLIQAQSENSKKPELQAARIIIFVSAFFGYMAYIVIFSLLSIKIKGFFGFYRRQTHPVSFLNFVYYLSKMTYPLCYETLYIFVGRNPIFNKTDFYRSIGNLKVVPVLGYDFPKILAFVFVILTVLFMFDFFKRVMKWLGFKIFDYTNEQGCEEVGEGKKILQDEEEEVFEKLDRERALREETLLEKKRLKEEEKLEKQREKEREENEKQRERVTMENFKTSPTNSDEEKTLSAPLIP